MDILEQDIMHEVNQDLTEQAILSEINQGLKNSETLGEFIENYEDEIYEYWKLKGEDPEPFYSEFAQFAQELWEEYEKKTMPF